MSLLAKLNAIKEEAGVEPVELEEFEENVVAKDRGASTFKIEEAGTYDAVIDMVVVKEVQEAMVYEVTFKLEDGPTIKESYWTTDMQSGKTYKVNKDGKKQTLFGWNKMGALNYLVNDEWNGTPDFEEKEITMYDFDTSKDVQKNAFVATSLIGKPVGITVQMSKQDGYPDATVEKIKPVVVSCFDPVTGKYANEKKYGKEPASIATFKDALENGTLPVLDKRKKSKGATASSGDKKSSGSANAFKFK